MDQKQTLKTYNKQLFLFLLVAVLALSACTTPVTVTQEQTTYELSVNQEEQFMRAALTDERKAYATYEQVLADFGDVRPFSNIIRAEQTHINALEQLFILKGYEFPQEEQFEVSSFTSVQEACQVGVQAEIENAAMYDEFFTYDLPEETVIVFNRLQQASLQNHLPAFERCS